MTTVAFIHGAVAMGCSIVAVFFMRFWRQSADRLFLFFAVAFAVLCVDYILLGLLTQATEWRLPVFMVRVTAFAIILAGIFDKNRR